MKSAFTVCCGHVLPKPISSYQVKASGTFHPKHPTLAIGSFGLKAADTLPPLGRTESVAGDVRHPQCGVG